MDSDGPEAPKLPQDDEIWQKQRLAAKRVPIPKPSVQLEYLRAKRSAQSSSSRFGVTMVSLVTMLAIVAYIQHKVKRDQIIADRQTVEASRQKWIASGQTRTANEQTQIARTRKDRDRQRNLAVACQLPGREESVRIESTRLLDVRALLTLEPIREADLFECCLALQRSSPPLPNPVSTVRHPTEVLKLHLSADGRYLITVDVDARVRVFHTLTARELPWTMHLGGGKDFVGNGQYLETLDESGTGSIFETATGKLIWRSDKKDDKMNVDLSSDNQYIAMADEDGTLTVFKLPSQKKLWERHSKQGLGLLRFISHGRFLLADSGDRTLAIFNSLTGKVVHWIKHVDIQDIQSVDYAKDGSYVAILDHSGQAHLFNVTTGGELPWLAGKDEVDALTLSADGKYIALATVEGGLGGSEVAVFESVTGKLVKRLSEKSPGENYFSTDEISFSVDGRYVAAHVSELGVVHVFETVSGAEVARLINQQTFDLASCIGGLYIATVEIGNARDVKIYRVKASDRRVGVL